MVFDPIWPLNYRPGYWDLWPNFEPRFKTPIVDALWWREYGQRTGYTGWYSYVVYAKARGAVVRK